MDKQRYARQLSLDQIGKKGQEALLAAHIGIIGCGGLGAIAANYLAGAGVGTLTLIDGDSSHISNLHRQVFFKENSSGMSKAEELAQHIASLNSEVEVNALSLMLDKDNIQDSLKDCDLVIECSDDVQCKYLVNDHCHSQGIPMIYGAIHKYEGMISFFRNTFAEDIQLRDIFPVPDTSIPTCAEVGVLNTIAGIIGLMQANEAIKYIIGTGTVIEGQLLTYDALNNEQQKIKLKKTWVASPESMNNENKTMSDLSYNDIPFITFDDLKKNMDSYRIISLLEEHEFVSLADHVERLPHSEYEWMEWEDDGKATVFYCASGARSMQVVFDLKQKNSGAEIYYLKAVLAELELG